MSSHDGHRSKPGAGTTAPDVQRKVSSGVVGKQTLAEQAYAQIVQRAASAKQREAAPPGDATVHAAAASGVATPSAPLPHGSTIQQLFGRHDISAVQAHTGPEAAGSAVAMGAEAYATGNHVVLGGQTDLHTVAHEAAHVVQQRGGVQLKGGVGASGDAYEQHADAVADAVVRGQSAEALLDQHASPGGRAQTVQRAVQRKDHPEDAQILDHQAHLKNTDVEIPALEGALLATRLEAVKKGLLSQSAFDASLDLSKAMTQLQPAAQAKGSVDVSAQVIAINAAQRLFLALQRDTASDKNFHPETPAVGEIGSASVTERNPYTKEARVIHAFGSNHFDGPLQQLPMLIHEGKWELAFRDYRDLMNGLDRWVSDQLRAHGKGGADTARGDAHDQYAAHLTGLEKIADKHATRLPAVFHPDPKTVEKEKAAGRPVADTIPMSVYFWKDDKTGKVHLHDLTTPGRAPQEQTIDGPPTAAAMNTFFEEVARYPEGEVRYTLPDGARGISPTSGKVKWYEWVAYAGLLLAGIGLTVVGGIGVGLLAEGASVIATTCFALGTLAGGVSAGGHLVDSARLGTATTATVVLDVAQIAASFAQLGAMGLTVKAGSASAALAGSRYFVPAVGAAAVADSVQLVALTDVTFAEMSKIQQGAGSDADKQRAISVLLTQLIVTGGLTVLSVQGARNARALAGKPLEIVEQNSVKVARVAGESTPEPAPRTAAREQAKGPTSAAAQEDPAKPRSGNAETGPTPTNQNLHESTPRAAWTEGLDEAQIEHVRRQLGDSLSSKMSTGTGAFTGAELVEVAEAVSGLRQIRNVRGVDDWVAFELTQNPPHMRNALAELRSAKRRATQNPGRTYEIGQDAHAPVREGTTNAQNPKGDPMRSFDMAEREGDALVKSIEVTSANRQVKGVSDLTEGVRHASDKVASRIQDKSPIPGKALEVEIRIDLFKGNETKGTGVMTYDGTGNYTYSVNNGAITPPTARGRKNPGNIFADFAKELPKIGGSSNLNVVTLADDAGNVVATFHREGIAWKWLEEPTL